MRLLRSFFILLVMTNFNPGFSAEFDCSSYDEVFEADKLLSWIDGTTFSKKILSLKVNHDGTGSVQVLVDASGNLVSFAFDYTIGQTIHHSKKRADFKSENRDNLF